MANLYEINASIDELLERGYNEECVDMETGEIDESKVIELLDSLEIEQKVKFENLGCYIKNLDSDIKAMREEEKTLAERRRVKENKLNYLKNYLTSTLQDSGYTKFETPRCVLSFRKSEQVYIEDETKLPIEYITIKTTESPNKTMLKEALKSGEIIDGVRLDVIQNLQIK